MDNGQKLQSATGDVYFTAGVGNTPASQNTTEDIPSLNDAPNAWRTERSHKNMGNSALFSEEVASADQDPNSEPTMGKIISLTPQPQPAYAATDIDDAKTYNYNVIRIEGDHITKAALSEISRAEEELAQTGNISNFYDEVRNMMEDNLVNSFNRKLVA